MRTAHLLRLKGHNLHQFSSFGAVLRSISILQEKTVKYPAPPQQLKRSLSLWLAVLYGFGVTVGAGIYVLVGVAAGRSGIHAPLVMSFAKLGTRIPVSGSEAAYVEKAFNWPWLSLIIGSTAQVFICPKWVPVAGLASTIGLLLLDLVVR